MRARHIVMYILYSRLGFIDKEIADALRKERSTVTTGRARAADLLGVDPAFRAEVNRSLDLLRIP